MDSFNKTAQGCPWLQPAYQAAYAAQGVVSLLDSRLGFASPYVRRLFAARSPFALTPDPSTRGPSSDPDRRFLGAVLAKLAGRGNPAPCSISVERYVLAEAYTAGVLRFEELSESGALRFECTPHLPGLEGMLAACLVPELTLDAADAESLLAHYVRLCNGAEAEMLAALADRLPDRRLALLFRPQRTLGSMLPDLSHAMPYVDAADRVDFALELPFLDGNKEGWRRLVLEVDGPRHAGAQTWKDAARDRVLADAGWEVVRVRAGARGRWAGAMERIGAAIQQAVPAHLLLAARQLRNLPPEQKAAIQGLVLLPVAEAQLTAALARLLYDGVWSGDPVIVAGPQALELGPAVRAAAETVRALAGVHRLEPFCGPTSPHVGTVGEQPPETGRTPLELRYYGLPSAQAWAAVAGRASSGMGTTVVVAPSVAAGSYVGPLLPALPRPANIGDERAQRQDETEIAGAQEALLHLLQNVFRKVAFLPGQVRVIERALQLRPTVGLLPTAGGKSLCYQLASMCEPGLTVVVAPLRSLMRDQLQNLEALGIHRCSAIMSGQGAGAVDERLQREARQRAVSGGHDAFLFVSPERLQMPGFNRVLQACTALVPVVYGVVDEAHCVLEWGHDFRPAYLHVARRLRDYCTYGGHRPCVLALTGTASRTVLGDVLREVGIHDPGAIVEPRTFERPELDFEVYQVSARRRMDVATRHLRRALKDIGWPQVQGRGRRGTKNGLVFTFYASAGIELGVPRIAAELQARVPGLEVDTYAGSGRDRYLPGDEAAGEGRELEAEKGRRRAQDRFKTGESPVLVATHAFGMGIDKSDVRFVLHTMLPRSLEEYAQQAGRVGRDRQRARCILLFCDDQPELADELLDPDRTPLDSLLGRIKAVRRESRGDAVRLLWFLTSSFLGASLEKELLEHVVSGWLAPCWHQREWGKGPRDGLVEIPFGALPDRLVPSEQEKDVEVILEKVLYRLSLVGAISGYWKDYTGNVFLVDLQDVRPEAMPRALEIYLRSYIAPEEVAGYMGAVSGYVGGQYAEVASACGGALIDFVYRVIEPQRRRALAQMLRAARQAVAAGPDGPRQFREGLVAYLHESEFTEPVRALAAREGVDLRDCLSLLEGVRTPDDVTRLWAACREQLEDYPGHIGLLLVAGLCGAMLADPRPGLNDLQAGFRLASVALGDEGVVALARHVLAHADRLAPSATHIDAILHSMLGSGAGPALARLCMERATPGSAAHQLAAATILATLAS